MKIIRNLTVGVLFSACLTACSPGQTPIPAGEAPTGELPAVEAIVAEYFDRFEAYDYLGMRALATSTFEIHDHGIRLTHPEFEDYVRNTAERPGSILDFGLSQFNTDVTGDVARTTFLLTFLDAVSLSGMEFQRSSDQWLIDRIFFSSVDENPEPLIRQFYHHIKAYNYDDMRAMVTPGFRIMYGGLSLDWEGFEQRHRAEEAEVGPASSRPKRFLYELSDFQIESTPEVVYASFVQTSSETESRYWNLFVLRRVGSHWRVHFVGSLQGAE